MSQVQQQPRSEQDHLLPLDAAALKADFPILAQANERGQPLVYLDSAASAQKPRPVLDALDTYYRRYNAGSPRECIFVRNTTEAINLVAQTWGRRTLRRGDLIVNTVLDHHSNLVPWQLVAEETGAEVAYVPVSRSGQLDLARFASLLDREPKLVAFSHVSNAVGTVNDALALTRQARQAGATVLIDAAQSAPHRRLDVQALGCDFLAISGHKMLAPMGSGVLYGRLALLEEMPPFMAGGGMIERVSLQGSTWAEPPGKFEAGTPAVGEAIGLGVAVEYLAQLGMDRIQAHEEQLAEEARNRLSEIPGVELHGPFTPEARSGIVGFTLDRVHPTEVAEVLDADNIAVRAGRHCCHPLFQAMELDAIIRASFYVYNTRDDVDRLVRGVKKARHALGPRSFVTGSLGDPCARRLTA